jgi:hypothetical protein
MCRQKADEAGFKTDIFRGFLRQAQDRLFDYVPIIVDSNESDEALRSG